LSRKPISAEKTSLYLLNMLAQADIQHAGNDEDLVNALLQSAASSGSQPRFLRCAPGAQELQAGARSDQLADLSKLLSSSSILILLCKLLCIASASRCTSGISCGISDSGTQLLSY
jgi:hypothetical protein